ncbi:MAG: right-handed parallel beta-helix repeat-containing protein [Candidatus Aenigmarchaeota archaeon]|nr:right-handed parallel beta-helix repeat-containing protein [Candidatus Aenigmarchaeota archaeon]
MFRKKKRKSNPFFAILLVGIVIALLGAAASGYTPTASPAGKFFDSDGGLDIPTVPETYADNQNGNDNNPCTFSQPCKTIQRAINAASRGYTVYIRGGTTTTRMYNEKITFTVGSITLTAYQNEKVALDGIAVGGGVLSVLSAIITVPGRSDITIKNIEVRNSDGFGILVVGKSKRIILENMNIHDNRGMYAIFITASNGRTEQANSIIRNNKIHDNHGGGIFVEDDAGSYIIEKNEVYDNLISKPFNMDIVEIDIGGNKLLHDVIVRKNKVYITTNGQGAGYPYMIRMSGPSGGVFNYGYVLEDNSIYSAWGRRDKMGVKIQGTVPTIARYNDITNVLVGFYFDEAPNNAHIVHNTIYENFNSIVYSIPGKTQATLGVKLYNNLLTNSESSIYYLDQSVSPLHLSILHDGNFIAPHLSCAINWLVYDGKNKVWNPQRFCIGVMCQDSHLDFSNYKKSNEGQDTASTLYPLDYKSQTIYVDPYPNMDYHLKAGSPVIDKGTHLTITQAVGTNTDKVPVGDAGFFLDSMGGMKSFDVIKIGNNPPVNVISVDYRANTLTIDKKISFSIGEGVWYSYAGNAPDPGKYEWHAESLY